LSYRSYELALGERLDLLVLDGLRLSLAGL
jgi:hypothetical protein